MVLKNENLSEPFYLKKMSEICNKSEIRLYRDDSLSIFKKKSDTRLGKIKKAWKYYLKNTT